MSTAASSSPTSLSPLCKRNSLFPVFHSDNLGPPPAPFPSPHLDPSAMPTAHHHPLPSPPHPSSRGDHAILRLASLLALWSHVITAKPFSPMAPMSPPEAARVVPLPPRPQLHALSPLLPLRRSLAVSLARRARATSGPLPASVTWVSTLCPAAPVVSAATQDTASQSLPTCPRCPFLPALPPCHVHATCSWPFPLPPPGMSGSRDCALFTAELSVS